MTDLHAEPAGTTAVHPALAGRVTGSAALADAVRRLIVLCTSTTASEATTLAAARDLAGIADVLEQHVPDPLLPKTVLSDPASDETDLAARMPFDVVIGRHNPLATPLELAFEGQRARLTGVFTRPYEGPPGCVHGAVLASSFDIVFAAANFIAGLPGPTTRLEITYRRPTALETPCLFEGWVDHHDSRSVRTVGRLVQNDKVTVTAVGEFALLTREQIARMVDRTRGASSSGG
ncbi:MAG: hotdog domain-containing protein [Streptosporangiaceae bacterium]